MTVDLYCQADFSELATEATPAQYIGQQPSCINLKTAVETRGVNAGKGVRRVGERPFAWIEIIPFVEIGLCYQPKFLWALLSAI